MSKKAYSPGKTQLAALLTGVMVPIIALLIANESYVMLAVAIVIELVLIAWTVMLAKAAKDYKTSIPE